MSTVIRSSIERLSGIEEVSPEVEENNTSTSGVGDLVSFDFKYGGVTFHCSQIQTPQFTVNKLEALFSFPTSKKQDRLKLLGAINSFNKSRISLKAVLGDVEKDEFQVVFSAEFMCPDDSIVDVMIHPIIRILKGSGNMLVNMVGSHGVSIKGLRKND
ncbi:hypothetical protein AOA57_04330 [Pseudomonas sp. 2588-5]|nr:hypothetical protein AOA57_04330 [Pseudomonas sp. 2588-5]